MDEDPLLSPDPWLDNDLWDVPVLDVEPGRIRQLFMPRTRRGWVLVYVAAGVVGIAFGIALSLLLDRVWG